MSPNPPFFSSRLRVLAEPDPHLPARLLALVTCRNELPAEFRLVRAGCDRVFIEMRMTVGLESTANLVEKALKIPTVLSASLTHDRRTAMPPAARRRA